MRLKSKFTLTLISLIFLFVFSFRNQYVSAASNYTGDFNYILWLTTIGSVLVGLLVFSLMFYFIFKYREDKIVERKHIENENKFEAIWVSFAIILVLILIGASTGMLLAIQSPPPAQTDGAIELKVEAYQFYWEIRDENNKFINWTDDPAELRPYQYKSVDHKLNLDVGQNYMLNLTSRGVIHSFFAYGLSFKIDAIPGQFNLFYFRIIEPGEYIVACAEYCGIDHYNMKFTINAT